LAAVFGLVFFAVFFFVFFMGEGLPVIQRKILPASRPVVARKLANADTLPVPACGTWVIKTPASGGVCGEVESLRILKRGNRLGMVPGVAADFTPWIYNKDS